MASNYIPPNVNTVIVGNGPSALILSYLLHGNIPYYDPSKPHPDLILHRKLSESPCLLDIDPSDLTAHFAASRLSYSTQALPVNVLLDTLIRPLADTEPEKLESCVKWCYEQEKAVPHVVLGNTAHPGGQWADNPVSASWDIGALSYAEMLSLPGYTFEKHYHTSRGVPLPDFYRPTRREMADYLATYPGRVDISDTIHTNVEVRSISRRIDGFYVGSHNIACKHLVLASGTFSQLIPPRPLLTPLNGLSSYNTEAPFLVVGSGFTAADVILSIPPGRRVIHIFKWDPEGHPSPLRACHPRAYPEYATIYRQMKHAASKAFGSKSIVSPFRMRKSNPCFQDRDWDSVYEGFPNTYIKEQFYKCGMADLTLQLPDGSITQRRVSSMSYVIGRRGSLGYLDEGIALELKALNDQESCDLNLVSGQTLRSRVSKSLEVAPNVFVIGSLTGDSLIRFAYGGCVLAAREIIGRPGSRPSTMESSPSDGSLCLSTAPSSPFGAEESPHKFDTPAGGHSELHLDRSIRSLDSHKWGLVP